MTTTEMIESLEALLVFYKDHPDMPVPLVDILNIYPPTREEFLRAAATLGTFEKVGLGEWFVAKRQFGSISLEVNILRNEICERVKTSTRHVPETIVPAREAETIPAHEEDVWEWKCPESLLAKGRHES